MIIEGARLAMLGAVAVLVSCNGDADAPATLPDVTPTSSPAPETGPSTDVDPPVEPDDAHDYSAEGVEAFTVYAIDVINYAYQTNDVSLLQQIMTADCQTCAKTVNQLSVIGKANGRIDGGLMVPESITGFEPADGVQTSAGVDLTVTASTTVDGDGRVRNRESDRDLYFVFNLARDGNRWLLDEILHTDEQES